MRGLAWAAVFALLGCSESGRQEVSDQEANLAKAYAGLILHREQFGQRTASDSLALYRAQVDSILKQYGFTRKEFLESFLDLVDTPDRFEPLFKSLSTELQQEPRQ